MLITELKKYKVDIADIQFSISIVIGQEFTDSELCNKLLSIETNGIISYIKTNGYKDNISGVIDYLYNVCCINDKKSKKPFVSLHEYNDGRYSNLKDKIKKACINIISVVDVENLLMLYANTTYCKNYLLSQIKNNFNQIGLKSDLIEVIYNDYLKWVSVNAKNHFRFRSNEDTPTGWLVSALGYYMKNKSKIYSFINEKSLEQNVNSDSSTSLIDLMSVGEERKSDYNLQFDLCASKIAEASAVAYYHKEDILYDIYSYAIKDRINLICQDFNMNIDNNLKAVFKIENSWDFKDGSYNKTKIDKHNLVVDKFKTVLNKNYNITEIYNIYMDAINANESIEKTKDGSKLFTSKTHNVKSSLSTGEKFEKLYEGHLAVRELLDYLEHKGIDPLSIDPRIFRNIILPRRFHTVEEYLVLKSVVLRLIDECDSNKYDAHFNKSNDSIYDYLCTGIDGYAKIKDYLEHNCTLGNLKDFIKLKYAKSKNSIRIECRNLYYKYKDILSIFCVYQDGNNLKYAITETESQELYSYIDSRLKVLCKQKGVQYSNSILFQYFTLFNYREDSCLERFKRNKMGELQMKDIKLIYRIADLLTVNKLQLKNAKFILNKLTNILLGISKGSSYNIIYLFKVCFSYMNTLKYVMALEGHDIIKNNTLYIGKEDNIVNEFSYLDDVKEIERRVTSIKICYMIFSRRRKANNENILYLTFGLSHLLQNYFEMLLETLAMGGNIYLDKPFTKENIIDEFKNDGDYSAKIRLARHKAILEFNKEFEQVNECQILQNLNLLMISKRGCNYFQDLRLECFYTLNSMIKLMPDLYGRLNEFNEEINCSLKVPTNISVLNEFNEEILKVLEKNCNTLLNMSKVECNDETFMIRDMLRKCATCDNGYIIQYNEYFVNLDSAGRRKYLHDSGYWVIIDKDYMSKIERVKLSDYERIRGILE